MRSRRATPRSWSPRRSSPPSRTRSPRPRARTERISLRSRGPPLDPEQVAFHADLSAATRLGQRRATREEREEAWSDSNDRARSWPTARTRSERAPTSSRSKPGVRQALADARARAPPGCGPRRRRAGPGVSQRLTLPNVPIAPPTPAMSRPIGNARGAAGRAAEIGPGPVLLRDLAQGQRPIDGECRVVVAHPTRRQRRVERGNEVAHLGVVAEGLKTMGEAFGNIELTLIVRRELEALPAAIGRRIRSEIDDDVPNGASSGSAPPSPHRAAHAGNACPAGFPAPPNGRCCVGRSPFSAPAPHKPEHRRCGRRSLDDRAPARVRSARLRLASSPQSAWRGSSPHGARVRGAAVRARPWVPDLRSTRARPRRKRVGI